MEQSRKDSILNEMLKSSKLVSGGFMGNDVRTFQEIIAADLEILSIRGYTLEQIAERMRELTVLATPYMGIPAERGALKITVEDFPGILVCPWPHPGRFAKRITTVENTELNRSIRWSDLNIHLIEEHGFFEGKGSKFRLEPGDLIDIIFDEEEQRDKD